MWELGVIQKYESPQKVFVSHLVSTNTAKTSWVFPENAIIFPAESNQIIMRSVQVVYHQSVRIRVSLNLETVSEANSLLERFE